ncbi:MAG: hypothetical protein WDW38_004058 [Sanguina aurantia]
MAPFTATKPVVSAPVSRTALRVEANRKVQKKQKIILTSNVQSIGEIGDIKMVPLGYWRNYLMPNKLAALADENILLQIQNAKESVVRKQVEEKALAQAFANALATISKFIIKKKVGDKDQIYGSVQTQEVADAIYQQTGRSVADCEFVIPEIKAIGTYECQVRLHPSVMATFSVVVQKDKTLTVVAKAEPVPKKKK